MISESWSPIDSDISQNRNCNVSLYLFRYLWDSPETTPHVGYMADEVRVVAPHAVVTLPSGFDAVDYSLVSA